MQTDGEYDLQGFPCCTTTTTQGGDMNNTTSQGKITCDWLGCCMHSAVCAY